MRYLIIMPSILAITFTVPASAQQTNVADQQTWQQAEAIVTQYTDAVNKGDTTALGATYAPNAIDINPSGIFKDAGTHFEITEKVHKMGLILKAKVDDVEPIFGGQGAIVTAPYTSTFADPAIPPGRGNMLLVLVRAGESWKIRAITASRLVSIAPTK
jgi:ketosteroid isomerase-like protein